MTQTTQRVAVLGGGSFGTALANILADNGHQVCFWMRDKDAVAEVSSRHENSKYLPGYKLNPAIVATHSQEEAVKGALAVFLAVPSKAMRGVARDCRAWSHPQQIYVSTSKGIEADSFKMMSQVIAEELPEARVGVLSGPNLAKEIATRMLTSSVIASEDADLRTTVQQLLSCKYFRVYANIDVFGIELCGALKNIYGIASGMADALGMGENTKSMLITRSLAEMSRFGARLGANPLTFLGLGGVGDLIVTCHSPLSRNFRVGRGLAKGEKLDAILAGLGGTAEGVNTTAIVKKKADELQIYMPLVQGLYEILFENGNVFDIIKRLMLGAQNTDVEFVLPSTKN
ncbi:Glycerol-3-phosphate dehydrogenase (NAD(P)+) [gamma proteobacterium HdN1]|nr:Glycerol-3-phosphate dehydrogenase (NAD(P)+) [gamma proteobacterium HdN1]